MDNGTLQQEIQSAKQRIAAAEDKQAALLKELQWVREQLAAQQHVVDEEEIQKIRQQLQDD